MQDQTGSGDGTPRLPISAYLCGAGATGPYAACGGLRYTISSGQKANRRVQYAEYTGLALLLPCSTFMGYAIGYFLDKAFGTTWMQIVFLILGSIGGFVALIRQVMRDSHDGA